ncbi:MAG: Abi family protein [Rikenellaceae bacterium]
MNAIIKKATTVDEQIGILSGRGLVIEDIVFAKDKLLNIGYYRLGFYSFHFEINPNQSVRTHRYKAGSKFESIIELYDFDNRLRHLLLFYLHKIEVNLRTRITYDSSLYYKDDPCWFVNEDIMRRKFVDSFDKLIYDNLRGHNSVISKHHVKHACSYAPAWKTLEFLTIGNVEMLYKSLKNDNLKRYISNSYGCSIRIFCNYIYVIRIIRNVCSHGNCIYNFNLPRGIRSGVATSGKSLSNNDFYNLNGVAYVILYFLGRISTDLSDSFIAEYNALFSTNKSHEVDLILRNTIKLFAIS